jgi:hypothetical protein
VFRADGVDASVHCALGRGVRDREGTRREYHGDRVVRSLRRRIVVAVREALWFSRRSRSVRALPFTPFPRA